MRGWKRWERVEVERISTAERRHRSPQASEPSFSLFVCLFG